MANLEDKQLKERYQTLITTSNISDASPVVGALQNGKGAALTQITLANGTVSDPAYSFTADTDTGIFSSGTGLLDLVTAGSTALTINGNQLTVGLGSVSAPSYSFIGDVNTGLFASGADAIGLVTGGTSRLAIDSSGNVGIGGTATKKLDIHHADTDGLRFTTADGAETFIDFGDASDNNIGGIIYDHADNHMRFRTNNAERIRMFSDGDVSFMSVSQNRNFYWDAGNSRLGIGTTSPSSLLHLENASSPAVRIKDTTNNVTLLAYAQDDDAHVGTYSNHDLIFDSNSTERLRIDSSGNVGIGATSVTSTFRTEIAGGDFRVGDTQGEDAVEIGWSAGGSQGFVQVYDRGDSAFRNLMLNNSLLIESGGNVGIGATSAAAKLQVEGDLDVRTATNKNLHIKSFPSFDNFSNEGVGIGFSRTSSDADLMAVGVVDTDKLGMFSRNGLIFATGGNNAFQNTTEAMRINADRNVAIGTTSPEKRLHITDGTQANQAIRFGNPTATPYGEINYDASGFEHLYIRVKGTTTGYGSIVFETGGSLAEAMRISSTSSVIVKEKLLSSEANLKIGVSSNDTTIFNISAASVYPQSDGVMNLGFSASAFRYNTLFATTGTINTSDEKQKQDIEELNEAEKKVAQKAKTLIRKYRMISSVEEKGDDARIHVGIIAQDLEKAFADEGLDAGRYGMFIKETTTNDDGEEQTAYAIRYNELLAFIISTI